MKKFELIYDETETIEVGGKNLYRIIAIKDFGKVKAGSLGGFVESEMNLSQEDNSWIADDAMVYGGARVEGNALLIEEANVSGDVVITDNVVIEGDAKIQNTTGNCITIGNHMHIACGALIDAPDQFASITTHDGTLTLFRNDENGIDICFYHGEEFIHQSVSEFLEEYSEKRMLSFSAMVILGAFCNIEEMMKAKADSMK